MFFSKFNVKKKSGINCVVAKGNCISSSLIPVICRTGVLKTKQKHRYSTG